jgi:hypothetical protein
MFELIFHIFAEILLQAMAEMMFSIGLGSMGEAFSRKPNPVLAAIGYGFFGAILGGVSLLLFPHPFIVIAFTRIVNLVVTPIVVGLVMASLGTWKLRRKKVVFRIDRFSYGYLFALSFALVRYHCLY